MCCISLHPFYLPLCLFLKGPSLPFFFFGSAVCLCLYQKKKNTGQLKQVWLCKSRPACSQNRYLPKSFLYHWAILSGGAELSMTPTPIQSLSLHFSFTHSLCIPDFAWPNFYFLSAALFPLHLCLFQFGLFLLSPYLFSFTVSDCLFLFSLCLLVSFSMHTSLTTVLVYLPLL